MNHRVQAWSGTLVLLTLLLASCTAPATSSAPTGYAWLDQFGTTGDDVATGVAVDSSDSTFVAGVTTGQLTGSNLGFNDSFLAKYDTSGTRSWIKQFGTSADDVANAVTVDVSGDAIFAGSTDANGTYYDLLVAKYATDGTRLWVLQYGGTTDDYAYGVATDAGSNILVTGYTDGAFPNKTSSGLWDAFLAKFDSTGSTTWVHQFGTSDADVGRGVATDAAGNAYVVGWTAGSLATTNAGSYDAFLQKYDQNGQIVWQHQFGTNAEDAATGVAVDANGNVYVVGYTYGALGGNNAGHQDVFLAKFASFGPLLWLKQFGTTEWETAQAVALDGNANVIVSGWTSGALSGANAGSWDVFVAKYDTNGNPVWMQQFGTSALDLANAVSVDSIGSARVVGYSKGMFTSANAGGKDAFIASFPP